MTINHLFAINYGLAFSRAQSSARAKESRTSVSRRWAGTAPV